MDMIEQPTASPPDADPGDRAAGRRTRAVSVSQ